MRKLPIYKMKMLIVKSCGRNSWYLGVYVCKNYVLNMYIDVSESVCTYVRMCICI